VWENKYYSQYTPVFILDDIHHVNHDHTDITYPSCDFTLRDLSFVKKKEGKKENQSRLSRVFSRDIRQKGASRYYELRNHTQFSFDQCMTEGDDGEGWQQYDESRQTERTEPNWTVLSREGEPPLGCDDHDDYDVYKVIPHLAGSPVEASHGACSARRILRARYARGDQAE